MIRFLPLSLEIIGIAGVAVGAYLILPALGLVAVGAAVFLVGYSLEV